MRDGTDWGRRLSAGGNSYALGASFVEQISLALIQKFFFILNLFILWLVANHEYSDGLILYNNVNETKVKRLSDHNGLPEKNCQGRIRNIINQNNLFYVHTYLSFCINS